MITTSQIAKVLGIPLSRVELYWPLIEDYLASLCGDDYTDKVKFAALATIRVECPPFTPIHEYGSDALHEKLYAHRMGNVNPGDGARYAGRGFIQITGELNYKHYGELLGVDLIDDPEDPNDNDDPNKALEPNIAAAIFAAYFHERGCDKAANAEDWTRVRKIVNGGTNGLQAFLFYVQNLATTAGSPELAASAAAQLKTAQAKAAAAK